MSIERKQLKTMAREAMRSARPAPFWVSLLLTVITALLQLLSMSITGRLGAYRIMLENYLATGTLTLVPPVALGGFLGWLLPIALDAMGLVLSVGFVIYALRVWRRQEAGVGTLFDGFGIFFRAILTQLLNGLLISLLAMVYVVPMSFAGSPWWLAAGLPLLLPMIIGSYSFRLVVYVMLDEPGLSCLQCFARSWALMRGHRWELFVLDLSFLGWYLLAAIIPIGGLLLMVWISVYTQVVLSGFYERRMREYMEKNAPPVMPQ